MAARPWRLILPALALAITLWLWALAGVLFVLRWNAVERPGPPLKELFPYGEMRVGVDASYPPFAAATADDLFGLDIDLGRAIAERLGVPVRFVNMGYDGLYDSLKADQVDVVISALVIDYSRANDVLYTIPYYNAGFVLVSRADRPFMTMNELSSYALAFEFGSDADTLARAWLRRIPPFETRPYELPAYALDAVRLGQADAALVDATAARLYGRDFPGWNMQMQPVTDSLYAAAVRIDRGKTWEAINYALQTLADDGTLAALVERWL